MKLRNVTVVMLALLLAAMAMVPMVSAADSASDSNTQDPLGQTATEHHTISSDYMKDAKPAPWLSESEMMTTVISQKTLGKFGNSEKTDIITLPIEFLNAKTSFTVTKENPDISIEKDLTASTENIVLIRLPKEMYKQFVQNAHDGKISLPGPYFFRHYENLTDLNSHMKRDGDTLRILPSDKYPLQDNPGVPNGEMIKPSSPMTQFTKSGAGLIPTKNSVWNGTLPHLFGAWEKANRTYPTRNYDYCIGQIRPVSWTLLGAGNDQFELFQEREYKFNSNEAIEIVVAHRDRSGNGILELFPTTWRSGASVQLPQSGYVQFPGYVAININNLPHSFGYHVQFASGFYYIDFEDMETLDFIKRYIVTSAQGTSSFTDLAGSSEYKRETDPTTNTFEATTTARDEWARKVNDADFQYATNVWTTIPPTIDQHVSVSTNTDNGRYTTTSHAAYP
ncbi:hypothetical protein [Methanoregula sp.]|uniref:hypothetical protein n=1 Tax=Methanoregula sp. TaxID=2052170 RepID=UPI003567730D